MAGLTKSDRIKISADLVGVEDTIKQAESGSVAVDDAIVVAEEKDLTNRKLADSRTFYINPYQTEAEYLDGTERTQLTESLIEDSARKVVGNTFFPVDPNTPLPSLSDGVWRGFAPFARTHAVGKTNLEADQSTGNRNEQDIVSDINSKISEIESEPIPNNATGQKCLEGGSCAGGLGGETSEAECLLNGGVWTPGGSDFYEEDTVVTGLLSDLVTLIQEWNSMLVLESSTIPSDTNSTRNPLNQAALSDISSAQSVISSWQSVQDFDTTTTLPLDCSTFDSMTEGDFEQAKLQPTTISAIKTELTQRSSFITTRLSQLTGDGYLGHITQDVPEDTLSSKAGLYGERILFLNMRLDLLTGSLTEVIGLELSKKVQDKSKDGAKNVEEAMGLVMTATKLAAPGLDTFYLNLISAQDYTVGDRVYTVADDQEELSGSIVEIDGNRVKLTFKTPKKYTLDNNTRFYKVL